MITFILGTAAAASLAMAGLLSGFPRRHEVSMERASRGQAAGVAVGVSALLLVLLGMEMLG
jgi:hypothetical protein